MSTNAKAWGISLACVGVVLVAVAIFFYANFFRQTNAPLIETVPADAAFVVEINDNEQFVKSSASLMPYLTELFALDGLAGFESFLEKMKQKNGEIVVSGFVEDGKVIPVFSTRMDEHYFKNMLKLLQIDPRNHIQFEEYEIYSYGTHYKDFKFVFHNSVFSVSEDVELLKKTIVQLEYPKGLSKDRTFKKLHKLVEKNTKQNWLLINAEKYASVITQHNNEEYAALVESTLQKASWCAYQIRFTESEIFLSGYIFSDNADFQKYVNAEPDNEFPQRVIPLDANNITIIDNDKHKKTAENLADLKIFNPEVIANYQHLAPVQSVYFTLKQDSDEYHYCVLKLDTNVASMNSFFAEGMNVDSLLNNTPKSIFDCESVSYSGLFSSIYKNDEYRSLMVSRDYFILSDTTTSMEYYKKMMKNSNYVETGMSFKFASTNTPSNAVFNFVLLNDNEELLQYMTADFKKKSSLKALKVLSFSHGTPSDDVIGSNIYLKF